VKNIVFSVPISSQCGRKLTKKRKLQIIWNVVQLKINYLIFRFHALKRCDLSWEHFEGQPRLHSWQQMRKVLSLFISPKKFFGSNKNRFIMESTAFKDEQRQRAIYNFWFGPLEAGNFSEESGKECDRLWWGMGSDGKPIPKEEKDKIDGEIADKFHLDIEDLAAGNLDHWPKTQLGVTACVLLGDQFTRNAFRGTGKAFSLDEKVQTIVLSALDKGMDEGFGFIVKSFWYLPLMHSEKLELHERMHKFLTEQVETLPEGWQKERAKMNLSFGEKHTEVIKRFGRYPHRNKALGRVNTPEEEEYLKDADSWGQ